MHGIDESRMDAIAVTIIRANKEANPTLEIIKMSFTNACRILNAVNPLLFDVPFRMGAGSKVSFFLLQCEISYQNGKRPII